MHLQIDAILLLKTSVLPSVVRVKTVCVSVFLDGRISRVMV